jgi:hypothetical protein
MRGSKSTKEGREFECGGSILWSQSTMVIRDLFDSGRIKEKARVCNATEQNRE